MIRVYLFAIVASILMTSPVYAQKIIKLSPNESKQLTNPLLWKLNATCHIQGSKTSNRIQVSVLENKGTVNGKNLAKGQATSVNVKNNDSISVSAEPGTTVNLVNVAGGSVEAVCYT